MNRSILSLLVSGGQRMKVQGFSLPADKNKKFTFMPMTISIADRFAAHRSSDQTGGDTICRVIVFT